MPSQKTYHNHWPGSPGAGLDGVVTWPRPKSAPFGEVCPSQHCVAVGHWVNSRHRRSKSRAPGKGPPQPWWPAGCGWGRRRPWLWDGDTEKSDTSVRCVYNPHKGGNNRKPFGLAPPGGWCGWSLVLLSHTRHTPSSGQHLCPQRSLVAKISWSTPKPNLQTAGQEFFKTVSYQSEETLGRCSRLKKAEDTKQRNTTLAEKLVASIYSIIRITGSS